MVVPIPNVFLQLASFIRVWGLVIAGLLIFIAVFLISNTIRITIISRSREIQIMRLVGAKNSYIRGPFLLEGAFIGLFGSNLPSVLVFLFIKWFTNRLISHWLVKTFQ